MRIGILSDTHGYLHPAFRDVFVGVDYILHAGDIGQRFVLQELGLIAPVIAVRGNIDGEDFFDLPKQENRILEGISFALIHNAGDVFHPSYEMRSRILAKPTDILISGHYHGYWCKQIDSNHGSVLWLSPGAAGNAGHHQERTALILTIPPKEQRSGDLLKDAKLEKINLGRREFGGYL